MAMKKRSPVSAGVAAGKAAGKAVGKAASEMAKKKLAGLTYREEGPRRGKTVPSHEPGNPLNKRMMIKKTYKKVPNKAAGKRREPLD